MKKVLFKVIAAGSHSSDEIARKIAVKIKDKKDQLEFSATVSNLLGKYSKESVNQYVTAILDIDGLGPDPKLRLVAFDFERTENESFLELIHFYNSGSTISGPLLSPEKVSDLNLLYFWLTPLSGGSREFVI